MDILIIGNGFDLAHKLPTYYNDFLSFSKVIRQVYTYDKSKQTEFLKNVFNNLKFPDAVREELLNAFVNRDSVSESDRNMYVEEYNERLSSNIWYDYFQKALSNKLVKGESWIDFESEIRDIIKFLDEFGIDLSENYDHISDYVEKNFATKNPITKFGEKIVYFDEIIQENKLGISTLKTVRKRLYTDLRRLTRALEIYIAHFVSQVECEKLKLFEELKPDHIISFNYSDTYERLYGNRIPISYIHGKTENKPYNPKSEGYDKTIGNCKLVLGIDEYWEDDESRMKNTEYTIFKKYAQRIVYNTGEYSNAWIKEMEQNYRNKEEEAKKFRNYLALTAAYSSISIFGHSLDVTDKDILSRYLGAEFTNVQVFCKDIESEGELIANVVALIGEQPMLDKVYNSLPSMRFTVLE